MLSMMLALALATPVQNTSWTTTDTAFEAISVLTLAADLGTTLDIKNHADQYETNFIMGPHPSDRTIYTYFASAAAIHVVVARILPPPLRRVFQVGTIGFQLYIVKGNVEGGLKIRF